MANTFMVSNLKWTLFLKNKSCKLFLGEILSLCKKHPKLMVPVIKKLFYM
jgi:hypothetical protein